MFIFLLLSTVLIVSKTFTEQFSPIFTNMLDIYLQIPIPLNSKDRYFTGSKWYCLFEDFVEFLFISWVAYLYIYSKVDSKYLIFVHVVRKGLRQYYNQNINRFLCKLQNLAIIKFIDGQRFCFTRPCFNFLFWVLKLQYNIFSYLWLNNFENLLTHYLDIFT